MAEPPARDEDYCAALEQIKQMLAKCRPDVTHLQGNAVLSPRILMILIERSESQIPAGILGRLRPLAEAVLNGSELGISEMVGTTGSGRCAMRDEKLKIQASWCEGMGSTLQSRPSMSSSHMSAPSFPRAAKLQSE
jgi:hypothetical protein